VVVVVVIVGGGGGGCGFGRGGGLWCLVCGCRGLWCWFLVAVVCSGGSGAAALPMMMIWQQLSKHFAALLGLMKIFHLLRQ
jgi:hypothetical protein